MDWYIKITWTEKRQWDGNNNKAYIEIGTGKRKQKQVEKRNQRKRNSKKGRCKWVVIEGCNNWGREGKKEREREREREIEKENMQKD